MTLASPSLPSLPAGLASLIAGRRRLAVIAAVGLGFGCLGLTLLAIGQGAIAIPPGRVAEILWARLTGDAALLEGRDVLVVMNIRLPRVLLGLLVGAGLAVSGALMQGLFRNPLADPGLVGVSAGGPVAGAAVGSPYVRGYVGIAHVLGLCTSLLFLLNVVRLYGSSKPKAGRAPHNSPRPGSVAQTRAVGAALRQRHARHVHLGLLVPDAHGAHAQARRVRSRHGAITTTVVVAP